MMPKTETSEDDAADECLAPVKWEEVPAIKAERRRRWILVAMHLKRLVHLPNTTLFRKL